MATAADDPPHKRHHQPVGTTAAHPVAATPATALPQLQPAAAACALPRCLAPMGSDLDPNAGLEHDPQPYRGHMGASVPRLCGGCAFSDAAAMSAVVTKLQAELAQAKAALQEKTAAEAALQRSNRDLEGNLLTLQRSRRELEGSVLGLRSEVSLMP